MTEQSLSQPEKTIRIVRSSNTTPSRLMELVYFGSLFYTHMGSALGISISLLGAAMLAGLAAWCLLRLRSRLAVYRPIVFPACCAISFIAVQVVVYDESVMGDYVRGFVTWILSLIIAQSLTLRRGFLQRFALVVFLIGVMALPFLSFQSDRPGMERVGLDRESEVSGELRNPNGLAAWFGFCAVYFMAAGTQTRRNIIRLTSWLCATGCLFIVGLTVSRGALFGVALAFVIVTRHLLKRGFLPILLLIIFGGLVFVSGIFEQSAEFYMERGVEETGRLAIWPVIIERLLDSPFVGVGVLNISTYLPWSNWQVTPHNSFLFIALGSGFLPLIFFVAYWFRAARGAFRLQSQHSASAPFYLPLFIYAFVITMLSNDSFFSSWIIVTLSGLLAVTSETRRVQIGQQRAGLQVKALARARYVRIGHR